MKKGKKEADKSNEKIIKNMKYGSEIKRAEEWDQEYLKKFGMFKKALVLYSFKRYTDSLAIMKNLQEIINMEILKSEEKYKNLDKKWRAKLQINEEISKEILNYEITQEVLNYFKVKIPLATLLIYIDKMRKGNSFSIYNRHTYLNNQINQFSNLLKKTFSGYKGEIKTIKNKIYELQTWSKKKEKLQKENPELYEKFYRKYRAEMCPNILKNNKCTESYRDCKFAHYPNQLNLTIPQNQIKLLKNSKNEIMKKTKISNTITAWNYPKQKVYERGLQYDKVLVMNNYSTDRIIRSRSAGRHKSLDISKMRISYHEI